MYKFPIDNRRFFLIAVFFLVNFYEQIPREVYQGHSTQDKAAPRFDV
jgi:hypothetical protein